jgi:hypothetical protein
MAGLHGKADLWRNPHRKPGHDPLRQFESAKSDTCKPPEADIIKTEEKAGATFDESGVASVESVLGIGVAYGFEVR